MAKLISLSTCAWWLAGALAALAIIAPLYLWWFDQRVKPPPTQEISQAANNPNGNEPAQASAGISSASFQTPAVQPLNTGRQKAEIPQADSQPPTLNPEEVYQALMSPDPAQRSQALKTTSRSPEALYAFNAVYKRIVELSLDEDRQVAKHARFARSRMMALRALHEIPEPSEPEADETGQNDAGTTGSQDALETAVEPFDALQAKVLDPDPAVRLGGIEAAMSQGDEHIFDVLSQAVRGDYEADNRLTAVSELEQMLKSGLGDREQILGLLEETAADLDPRVAELSRLIIQEQLGTPNR